MSLIFKMKLRAVAKCLGAMLFALSVSGCSSTNFTTILGSKVEVDWSVLYLRGSFTWWEAEAKYKVTKVSDNLYRASVELIADNQPYDFKFADINWSPGTRCGYLNKTTDEVITENKVVNANCDTTGDNFKFTPSSSGLYHVYFDASNDVPKIYLKKAQD